MKFYNDIQSLYLQIEMSAVGLEVKITTGKENPKLSMQSDTRQQSAALHSIL